MLLEWNDWLISYKDFTKTLTITANTVLELFPYSYCCYQVHNQSHILNSELLGLDIYVGIYIDIYVGTHPQE